MGYKAKKNQLEKSLEDITASALRADPSSVGDSYHGYDRKDSQRAYLTDRTYAKSIDISIKKRVE